MADELKTTKLSNDEIISFCQLLSAAVKSKLPLADALLKHNSSAAKSRVANFAKSLALRLQSGYTIEEATKSLEELDPVVTRLMPLAGDDRLIEVFDIYTKYLIRCEIVRKQMSFMVGYPFFVMLMGFAILLFLNIRIFPGVVQLIHELSFFEGISLRLLYFANISYWPLSLVVPAIILYLFIDSFYIIYTGKFIKYSLWGKLTGLSKAVRLSEKARLAAMLSLYIRAGFTFEKAVAEVSSFSDPVDSIELSRVKNRLASGNSFSDAVNTSELLAEIMNGHESFEEMPEKLDYIYNGLNAEAILVLNGVSSKLFYISLALAGIIVLAVSAGFFGIYPAMIGGLK